MNIVKLKAKVESYREGLEEKSGAMVKFSKSGPVGMVLIDALVAVVEAQESRLRAIEARLAARGD